MWFVESQFRAAVGRPDPVRVLRVESDTPSFGVPPDVVLLSDPAFYQSAARVAGTCHAVLAWVGDGEPPGRVHARLPAAPTGDALRRLALTPFTPLWA